MRRKRSLLWWLTVLAVLAGLPFAVASLKRGLGADPATRARGDLLTTCTRVVDGDTIVIEGGGVARGATAGQPQGGERVRYIGIDTPETKDPRKPVEQLGREASEFNRQLIEGKQIRIEFDVVQRDRYKRLLGYVYVQAKKRNQRLQLRQAKAGW